MSNVHPFRRPERYTPGEQLEPQAHVSELGRPDHVPEYTWVRYNEDAFSIIRDGIVVGFVSIFPEIPFHSELVEKLPAVFAEHERVLRGDAL